jgi:hypothetical protein
MGFVILGSGSAFWYLGSKAFEKQTDFSTGVIAMLISILSTLILFLLSYKFTSHNRYAGYSKLLTHERYDTGSLIGKNFFCWEICIDIVRGWAFDRPRLMADLAALGDCVRPINNLEEKVQALFPGGDAKKDKWNRLRGCFLMLSCTGEKSGSWRFPLYIARVFAAINITLVYFGVYPFFAVSGHRYQRIGLALLFCVVIILWMQFLSKLYKQMLGSETVEAFCWKFVPIRARLIRELNNNGSYFLVGVSVAGPSLKTKAAAA